MNKLEPQFAIHDRFLDQPYTLAGRLIDPVSGTLSWQGKREHLRRKELEVLALLASAEGKQVSRDNFIAVVWQGNDLVGDRGLSNTIVFVRKSLRDEDTEHPVIRTIPRRGYQLAVPVLDLAAPAVPDVDAAFVPGGMIPECPGWRLVKRLSQSTGYDSWLAEPSEFGERDQGLRVFRFCRSEAHLQRLRREVTLLRYLRDSLIDNQRFALIQDWQLDEPPYFLARDYSAFGNIAEWGGLSAQTLAQRIVMMQGLGDAVAAMHALGVVHRRLSADTILVDKSDAGPQLKISAFDLGALSDRSVLAPLKITAAGLTQGVEDVCGALTTADDVYALGHMLLQLALSDLQAQPSTEWLSKIPNAKLQTLLNSCFGDAQARPSAVELAVQLRSIDAPESATPALSTPAIEAPPETLAPKAKPSSTPIPVNMPETIGNYRLLDRLGEGGMGSVFLAEQREPYRQVALKVIRSGLDGQQILSRFEAERQALALMNHPNVTTVLDSGLAADGRPFFAMEYVKGDDITHYCDAHNLNLPARIKLFLQVCDGVLHAHQKGVLHRDIKPSNLMVSQAAESAGVVKIIDFGLAKSLHGKLAAHTLHTSFGAFIGTPVYCSPEHISGSAGGVDTRSDIYSMGVVLYELLAGTTPIATESLENLEPEKVRELVCKSKRPSMREQLQNTSAEKRAAIAEHRSIKLDELPKTLEGDLSWVVGKCLERDPNDRYASVLELKKDLERWLELRPVEARPTSRWYRFRKLVRRNRGTSILIAGSVTALLVTTTASIILYLRAERSLKQEEITSLAAKQALEFQVKQIESINVRAMGIDLRKTLTEKLSEYGTSLNLEPLDTEKTQTRIVGGINSINFTDVIIKQLEAHYFEPGIKLISSDYQGNPALQEALWHSTAKTLIAIGSYQQAWALREKIYLQRLKRLGADDISTIDAQLENIGDKPDAEVKRILEDAIQRTLRLTGMQTKQTLFAKQKLARIAADSGNGQLAEALYREVVSDSEKLFGVQNSDTQRFQLYLGSQLLRAGKIAEAAPLVEKSYANLLAMNGSSDSRSIMAMTILSELRNAQGRMDQSIKLGQQAIIAFRNANGSSNFTTLSALNGQAVRLSKAGRYTEALSMFRELESLAQTNGIYNDTIAFAAKLGMGSALLKLGKLADAEPLLNAAFQLTETTQRSDGGRIAVARNLGNLKRAQGRLDEATDWYQLAIDLCSRIPEANREVLATAQGDLCLTLLLKGDAGDARKMLELAVANSRKAQVNQAAHMLVAQAHYALALPVQGSEPTAINLLREVVRQQETTSGVGQADRIDPLTQLAKLLNDEAQFQEALSHATAAIKIGNKIYPEGHYLVAAALTQYGRALVSLDRVVEAKVAFKKAQAIIRNTEGLDFSYQRALDVAQKDRVPL